MIPEIEYNRPELYDKQKAFVDDAARYTLIEASTKTGKSVGCIIWLFEQAAAGNDGQNFWWVAPVYPQAKIMFRRLKRFIEDKNLFEANESELAVKLVNGATIFFKSAEKPDNLYGEDIFAAVIDEATRCREESWYAIRSTLTATGGKVKIIGNVKGIKNWVYELARSGHPEVSYHKLTAYDAVEGGILTIEEVEDAKQTLPKDVFEELYLAIPRQEKSSLFAYSFEVEKHVGECEFQEGEIYLAFDFNVNPMTCIAGQHYEGKIRICKEWRLTNSDIYQMCQTIKADLGDRLFVITGDSSGNARSGLTRGNSSYYVAIKQQMNLARGQFKVPSVNPSIDNSYLLTNSLFARHSDLIIDSSCEYLIDDLQSVKVVQGEKVSIDKKTDPMKSHLLDCLRYYFWTWHRKFIKI